MQLRAVPAQLLLSVQMVASVSPQCIQPLAQAVAEIVRVTGVDLAPWAALTSPTLLASACQLLHKWVSRSLGQVYT